MQEEGGHIFVQLMHTGRVGHPANLPAEGRIVGPSAISAPGEMYTGTVGPQAHPVPNVMTEGDIEDALDGFAHASKRAVEAGFDGVELHGANGCLVGQLLNVVSNQRRDAWGMSIDGHGRFAIEAALRAARAIGRSALSSREHLNQRVHARSGCGRQYASLRSRLANRIGNRAVEPWFQRIY